MKKKIFSIFFALVLVLTLGLVTAVPAGAATTINVVPGDSIQAAIDAALSGTTINVAAGTYDELLIINVDGLTLLGAQANADPRPMSGGRSGAESIIRNTYAINDPALNPILIAASNVTINGFTISPNYAIDVGGGLPGGGLNKDLIKQESQAPAGNWVGTTIKYNILTATGYNIVDNCDELVQLKGVTNAVIEYNYGYHDILADSGGNAFNIAAGSADSVIRYNEAHRCGDYQYDLKWGGAIYTYESTGISVIGNKVVGGGGITFGASKATKVDQGWLSMRNFGGTVEGNIVEDAAFGLEIFADGATVSGNAVTGCEYYALNIIGSNVTIQDNNLLNSEPGILVEDKVDSATVTFSTTGVSINYNNIDGNTFGLENLAVAEVDATNNWWGTTDGTTIAGMVTGDVNYTPWLEGPFEESTAAVSFIATTEEPVIGIEVSPTFINFGAISAGVTVIGDTLTVTNTGNMPMSVSADLTEDTFYSGNSYFYTKALYLNEQPSGQAGAPTTLGSWSANALKLNFIPKGEPDFPFPSHHVSTKLVGPSEITLGDTYTGTVVFWAEVAD